MDLQQIEAEIKRLEQERKTIIASQRAAVLLEVSKQVKTYGFTAAELGLAAGEELQAKAPRAPRRSKEERDAEEQEKHQKAISEAKEAFRNQAPIWKFTHPTTGACKYYWDGKRGIKPAGEPQVVKNESEIV